MQYYWIWVCDELWMTIYKYYIMCKLASHVFQCLWWWGGNWMHEIYMRYIKWEKLRSWMKMKMFFFPDNHREKAHAYSIFRMYPSRHLCVYHHHHHHHSGKMCAWEEIFTLIYCKIFVVCAIRTCATLCQQTIMD